MGRLNIHWFEGHLDFLDDREVRILEHDIMAAFDKDDITPYYYDPEDNTIRDDGGFIIYDIYRIISPGALLLFKQKQETVVMKDLSGNLIELVWAPHRYSYFEECGNVEKMYRKYL